MDETVMVIGGGIGGLALAHGLLKAGRPVRVFERTRERSDWLQGYRIHINPAGATALRDLLPASSWTAFTRAASPGGGFGFLTDRGADLLGLGEDEISGRGADPLGLGEDEISGRHYGIGRIPLRQVLLAGLGDVLEPGWEFTSYDLDGDHVVAHFADGSSARGAVLVGADGANSRVRAQLLPRAAGRRDTGVLTIAGRSSALDGLPRTLTDRANIVIPRGRGSLFTAAWSGQVLWGYSDATERFPAGVERFDAEALLRIAGDRLRGWAPEFRDLVSRSDPATVNAFRVKSAIEVQAPPHPYGRDTKLPGTNDKTIELSTSRVTLLGDAIHSMTPMAGVGANTALRDAALLGHELTGGKPVLEAIETYEREMLAYGFDAVRLSLRNARQAAHSTALSRATFRTVLRVTAALPPLRRRFAQTLGN
jgi:salicylate hydroxylase